MSALPLEVNLINNETVPASWGIEAINSDGDGGIDVTVFSGPFAEARAREYARWKYDVVDLKVWLPTSS